MSTSTLSPTCTDEEAQGFAIQHYFLPDELAEARRMLDEGKTYEEVVAYLAEQSNSTLRDSGEEPPHLFFTIPDGQVFIYHPLRRFPHRPVLQCSVGHLASLALPRPEPTVPPSTPPVAAPTRRYQRYSLFDDVSAAEREHVEKTKRPGTRPKKLKFVEQPVRMGTHTTWWERPGWVVKDGHLGYVIAALKEDFYEVSLVHLKSHHAMASIFLSRLDETTHARVQGWVADVLPLTDWSQGIATILKEKTGEHKKKAWSKQLEDVWQRHRTHNYQFSLFDTGDHCDSPVSRFMAERSHDQCGAQIHERESGQNGTCPGRRLS